MNKNQYIKKLSTVLQPLTPEERNDILEDYEEHFAAGQEEEKTEEEIAAALGSPEKLGKELLAMYHVSVASSKMTTGNVLRAVWAGIGLGFFNLIIVLGPFLALVGILLGGWAAAIGLTLSPLLLPVNLIFYPGTFIWSDFFFLLTSCGIGILLGIGSYYMSKGLVWVFLRYLQWNISFVRGGVRE